MAVGWRGGGWYRVYLITVPMGAVLVIVVMVAAGSINVDISRLRIQTEQQNSQSNHIFFLCIYI